MQKAPTVQKMVWRIRSGARWILPSMAVLRPSLGDTIHCSPLSGFTDSLVGSARKFFFGSNQSKQIYYAEAEGTHSGLFSVKRSLALRLEASSASSGSLAKDLTNFKEEDVSKANSRVDLFSEMKQRFLSFKKHKYLEEPEHFRTLAEAQEPKFMVISCADSRACPSNILGFQPGEAFIVRNVANLVPPLENGPSETNAALEFAVNTLQVENILVVGHSRCGGIETLMSLQDDNDSSFVHSWILKAKVAKLRTKAAAPNLNFDQQCRHCELESINISLMNLLTYPWIEERVKKDKLSIHGGYYDFLNCTFEKWTLDVKSTCNNTEQVATYSVKDYWF